MLASPGLRHYFRFGDSGSLVDPYGQGRRATDLGPKPSCWGLFSHYGDQVTLGRPGALAGDADTAAGFDGATADGVWESSVGVSCAGEAPAPGPNAPFTMEAWVRPGRLDAHSRRVFSRESASGGTIVAARTDGLVFSRFVKAHTVRAFSSASGRYETIDVPERWATLKTPMRFDAWTYFAAVYDGTRMSLVVNGQLAGTKVTDIEVGTSVMRIGAHTNQWLEWDGLIDEAATYNAALTTAHAAAHYAAGIGAGGDR